MIPAPKMVAMASAIGVVLGDAGAVAWAALQATAPPTIGDLGAAGLSGAAASIAVLLAWKTAADKRIERLEDSKADKDAIADLKTTINEIKADVRYIIRLKQNEE